MIFVKNKNQNDNAQCTHEHHKSLTQDHFFSSNTFLGKLPKNLSQTAKIVSSNNNYLFIYLGCVGSS